MSITRRDRDTIGVTAHALTMIQSETLVFSQIYGRIYLSSSQLTSLSFLSYPHKTPYYLFRLK